MPIVPWFDWSTNSIMSLIQLKIIYLRDALSRYEKWYCQIYIYIYIEEENKKYYSSFILYICGYIIRQFLFTCLARLPSSMHPWLHHILLSLTSLRLYYAVRCMQGLHLLLQSATFSWACTHGFCSGVRRLLLLSFFLLNYFLILCMIKGLFFFPLKVVLPFSC